MENILTLLSKMRFLVNKVYLQLLIENIIIVVLRNLGGFIFNSSQKVMRSGEKRFKRKTFSYSCT